jgi:5-methylcytosine-specific restriction endonuclease McrA
MLAYIQGSHLVTRQSFRRAIFEAWEYKCAYCDEHADTLDHVIPKSKGGSNEHSRSLLPPLQWSVVRS